MNSLTLNLSLDIGLAALGKLPLRRELALPERLRWFLAEAGTPPAERAEPILQTVANALAETGLHPQGDAPPLSLPMPWARFCQSDPALPSPQAQRLMAAILALGLVPAETTDWNSCLDSLRGQGESLSAAVREAAALWLVSEGRLADGTPETEFWNQDRRQVLILRDVELPRRKPAHPLLRQGYRLLQGLAGLRQNSAPGLADYDALIADLAFGDGASLAFQQAVWWEASYRLSETGQFGEADAALSRYQQAETALAALLPGLAGRDSLGIGVALGRQAYYQGWYDRAARNGTVPTCSASPASSASSPAFCRTCSIWKAQGGWRKRRPMKNITLKTASRLISPLDAGRRRKSA